MIFQEKSDDIWTVKLMNFFCNGICHAMSGSVGTLLLVLMAISGLKIRIKGLSCLVPASRTLSLVLWRTRNWGSPAFFNSGSTFQTRDAVFCFDSWFIALLLLSLCFPLLCSSVSCPVHFCLFLFLLIDFLSLCMSLGLIATLSSGANFNVSLIWFYIFSLSKD